jgi:hypothetical protein
MTNEIQLWTDKKHGPGHFLPLDRMPGVCENCERFTKRKIIHAYTGVITNNLCIFCTK